MYSSTDILNAIDQGYIIIDPLIHNHIGTNSIDVTLGNTFFEVIYYEDETRYIGPYVYLDNEKVNIPKCGTLLGVTKEKVGTFGKVVAELRSRSTTRRKGITTNCDAGLGDIGYFDFWTLELSAFVSSGQPFVVVGQRIGQMIFYECKSEPLKSYQGQYTSNWPWNMIPLEDRNKVIKPLTKMK